MSVRRVIRRCFFCGADTSFGDFAGHRWKCNGCSRERNVNMMMMASVAHVERKRVPRVPAKPKRTKWQEAWAKATPEQRARYERDFGKKG